MEALEEQCGVVGLPAEVVTACWMANETQITRSLISRVSTSTQLLDMDWSFGVTTATNECDQVRPTLLLHGRSAGNLTANRARSIGWQNLLAG